MPEVKTGLLCMAYGSPGDEAGIEAYFTHIRGGRAPSPEALAKLVSRYQAIGGASPLAEITRNQADALGRRLGLPAFVGFKHSEPFIGGGAREAAATGVERLVGVPLAPHYARMSLGSYEAGLRQAWDGDLIFVPGFHDHPAFIAAVQLRLREALRDFTPERLFFTAHSLPARILAEGDMYQDQLLRSSELAAADLDIPWEFAYQSASHTGEPWLGPDLLESIERSGARSVLVCPIGFVADHLEILYDLDVETAGFCREHGVEFRRTEMFNDRPEFIEALAAVVQSALPEPSRT
ncbi:MAG TPA: ferrochelatase [Candidatus Dormibacteraeota bacterium]